MKTPLKISNWGNNKCFNPPTTKDPKTMAPAAQRRSTRSARASSSNVASTSRGANRQPLGDSTASEQNQIRPTLVSIFNSAQHLTSVDKALTELKKLYKSTEYNQFEGPFSDFVKQLFHSEHTTYFINGVDFLCKFLQYVSKLSEEETAKLGDTLENTAPSFRASRCSLASDRQVSIKSSKRPKKVSRKKKNSRRKPEVDELVASFFTHSGSESSQNESTTDADSVILDPSPKRRCSLQPRIQTSLSITNHDRIVSCCIDTACRFMLLADEDCRRNAVYFVSKLLSHVQSLDEELRKALEEPLAQRIRDRKPMIRAQAVLASKNFQDNKMTKEAFIFHFERDPEPIVRKALLRTMDTEIFGYEFLVSSTRDMQEVMRKIAFQRLGKVDPVKLKQNLLHDVIHNGLTERDAQVAYTFRTSTLEPWLNSLYDGRDLYKLLGHFDVLNHFEDVHRLLTTLFERDLDNVENNGTTTRLHQIVESFRERWINSSINCLPEVDRLDEKVITIWLALVKFCRANQKRIKPIKIRAIACREDHNVSIEKFIDNQERADELVELYERLSPDLVNLVNFLKKFVDRSLQLIGKNKKEAKKLEFMYQQLMEFIYTYEVGDEIERKTVQDVLDNILKENSLTAHFANFISPIIKCLFKLVYSLNSHLMINYISELINNVRSHLEDIVSSGQSKYNIRFSTIEPAIDKLHSAKKPKIDACDKRESYAAEANRQDLEFRLATIGVELNELRDELDDCIKVGDFKKAGVVNSKIDDLKKERNSLVDRRFSLAHDISQMSMVVETNPTSNCKLSSTMIGEEECSQMSNQNKEDINVFRNHTYDLVKCLHMYLGCLQNVKVSEVPETMRNHLMNLSLASLDDCFKTDPIVRSSMIACNGVTALVDRNFAEEPTNIMLLVNACFDPNCIENRTAGFKSLVDIICQHEDIEVPLDKVERFLNQSLREYGKYSSDNTKPNEFEFITAVIQGTAKLFYLKRLSSPEILSHLILWWYHPSTHSYLKQFIGIFLPLLVKTISRDSSPEDSWLRELLEETFVTSIRFLHDYIRGPGYNIMGADDIQSLINFLCNLIPISFHKRISEIISDVLEDAHGNIDFLKYLKRAKKMLDSQLSTMTSEPLAEPNEDLN